MWKITEQYELENLLLDSGFRVVRRTKDAVSYIKIEGDRVESIAICKDTNGIYVQALTRSEAKDRKKGIHFRAWLEDVIQNENKLCFPDRFQKWEICKRRCEYSSEEKCRWCLTYRRKNNG